jgi:hypothetical protein
MVVAVVAAGCRMGFETRPSTDAGPTDDAALEQQAVAWYRMDELVNVGSLQQIVDASGNGHHAKCDAVLCPTMVSGRGGVVARFAAAHELRVTGTPALRTEQSFTVTTWMKVDILPTANTCLVQKLFGTATGNSWQLCIQANGRLLFYSSNSISSNSLRSPASIALGSWHHVALTWDGALKQLIIDGALVAVIDALLELDDRDVVIGRDYDNGVPDAAFDGEVDEVLIFDRVLTLTELGELAAR